MITILRKTTKCIFIIAVFKFILISSIWAAPQKIVWAGFAFLSDYSDLEKEFYYSSKISNIPVDGQDSTKLETILRKKIKTVSNPEIEILSQGNFDSGNTVALALALDWENVCIEQLDSDLFKIVLNLHGQILVYDFDSMQVIATFPFGVRVNDAARTTPDKKYIQKLFEQLYFGKIGKINFLDEFVARLQQLEIKESYNHRIKVTEVVVGDKSYQYMPPEVQNNLAAYKTFVAQQFSSFLSSNQNIAVLPYTQKNEQDRQIIKGQAIRGKMAVCFDNQTVLNLEVPEEDIPIKITVRGFKKVKMDENHAGSAWVYGSFISLTVLDPLGDTVIDAKFKHAAVKEFTASHKKISDEAEIKSDWSAFEESLLVLFKELTQQISERSSTWISKKTKDKNVKKQFKNLEKMLKKI